MCAPLLRNWGSLTLPPKLIYRKVVMDKDERAMLAREARRIQNQIAHREKMIAGYQQQLPLLNTRLDEVLAKLADAGDDDA
jgi:hypothetical protein